MSSARTLDSAPIASSARRVAVVASASGLASVVAGVVGFVFGNAVDPSRVSVEAMQNIAAALYVLAPVVITHGVLTILLDRAHASSAARAPRTGSPSRDPWLIGAARAAMFGVPMALLARPVAAALAPSGAPPVTLALLLALGALPLSALVAGSVTGPAFARELELAQPRYRGTAWRYVFARHAVPAGLFNAAVNLAATFAIFPGPVAARGALAPSALVVADAAVSFALIALLVGTGTVTHARADARSGIAPSLERDAPSTPRRAAVLAAAALGWTGGAWLALSALESAGLSFTSFAVWRTLAFGGFAAFVALASARWTLATHRARAGG